MATFRRKTLKNGIVAIRIVAKCKDPKTNEWKTGSKTWKKPPDMSEYQARRELQREAYEFEESFRQQTQGLIASNKEIHFDEYANEWLDRQRKAFGVPYWSRQKPCVERAIKYFGHIRLKEITARMVQKYVDELSNHQIVKEHANLKEGKTLRLIAKNKKIKLKSMNKTLGASFGSFEAAHRGENINCEKAKDICNALGVDFDEYFVKTSSSKPYAKETIAKFKKCLSQILKKAKKEGLIEHNFASSDYIDVIKGSKREINCLNDDEARQFKAALDTETNIRWKTALYVLLMMGLRRSELCGLEWGDIDFENNTISIQRSSYDVTGIGLITKDPKTFTSRRVLTMPDCLVSVLKDYKVWYDKRKEALIDLWKDNNRIMISDEGKTIYPSTYAGWLRKVLKRAGIEKKISLHSLRHTNITLQLISGVDLKTVSSRAGHARASTTTDIYSHFIRSSDTHASKIIDSIFTGKNIEL